MDDLKEERIRRGLSQKAVAEAMGTTQSAVSRAERGGNPRQDFLQRYQRALWSVGSNDSLLELETLKLIIDSVARKHGLGEVYLFGSVARGEVRPDSDVDLMYRYDRTKTGHLPNIHDIQQELQGLLGREVSMMSLDSLERHAKTSRASRRFYEYAKPDMIKVA